MSDVQLLLATIEDSKTSISKEELEKVHSQVSAVSSEGDGLFWETAQGFPRPSGRWRNGLGTHLAMEGKGQDMLTSVGGSQLCLFGGHEQIMSGTNWLRLVCESEWMLGLGIEDNC